MRTIKTIRKTTLALLVALFFTSVNVLIAQNAKLAEIKIKTSAVCGECKEKIETALAFEKGVKKADLDLKTQIVTVSYNPKKTTPEKLREAIANAGYDADEVKANSKEYEKLPACCKKTASPH